LARVTEGHQFIELEPLFGSVQSMAATDPEETVEGCSSNACLSIRQRPFVNGRYQFLNYWGSLSFVFISNLFNELFTAPASLNCCKGFFMETDPPLANVDTEFRTVDLILNSSADTCGVDAFALALIKVEKQLRRLFTHLVFQFPCFSSTDAPTLRATLNDKKVYFHGLEKGFNALYPVSVEKLVGLSHGNLRARIRDATAYRNKIFHGQLTDQGLTRDDLVDLTHDLRLWCEVLANSAQAEFGYDGFARNSFQKSQIPDIASRLLEKFSNIDSYEAFIEQHMERKKHGEKF